MVRHYKRKPGSRSYGNYSEEQINSALKDVCDNGMSLRQAAKKHKISYGTLNNKYHSKRIDKKSGGQPVFSQSEEKAIIAGILKCADWGYPLNLTEIRLFVKSYLEKQGRIVSKFSNNTPGEDWARSFLSRNNDQCGQRLATNISAARASISPETVKSYFENLQESIKGIPPTNIYNYDEGNITDDPGKKLAIYRRGVKYPEKICNHAKSSTSLMMCGSADGTLLPPYIIYKAANVWTTWKENGPKGKPCCEKPCCAAGTRYTSTTHGWIDMVTFNDWFMLTFLPHAKRLEGKKVIIGDNLASHFCPEVIRACEENNINFCCLPPNSTHLMQPLDVAFFRPFKSAWRSTLTTWKMGHRGRSNLTKDVIPTLLKTTLETMDKVSSKNPSNRSTAAIKRNLISGFKACGIFPFNPSKVLNKIPSDTDYNREVNDSLTEFLSTQRYTKALAPRRKRKKINVQPGKSVTSADFF